MRGLFRSVLGLFKPESSEISRNPEPRRDGSNEKTDPDQAEVVFRVPGMS